MSSMQRFTAVLEVTAVTAIMWAAYKAMKLVEPGGFNYSPGLAMLIAASVLSIWHWREFKSYGIVSTKWRSGVNLGVAFTLLMLLGDAVELAFFSSDFLAPTNKPLYAALRSGAFRIPFYLTILLVLLRVQR